MASNDHGTEPTSADQSVRKLGLVAAINLVGFGIELVGGLAFGSVALLGDAFHMLFDALAYVIALGATVIARRSNPGGRWSFGLHRIEPFAAFLNGVLFIPMVLYLVYESYQRYLKPVEIDTTMTLLLATGGLLVNVASVYVLQGGEMSLNERGAFYHLLGDAGASVAVIVSMLVVRFADIYLVDPATAVIMAGLIVRSAVILLRESGAIFFQQSPVEPEEVRSSLEALDGVETVEDLHVWALSSQITVATVYVTDFAAALDERDALVTRIHDLLESEFDVTHATVEVVTQRHEHALTKSACGRPNRGSVPVKTGSERYRYSNRSGLILASRSAFVVTPRLIPMSPTTTATATFTSPKGTPTANSAFTPTLAQMFSRMTPFAFPDSA
jgi:cobalt-zinc-cadmium efflux system protein